MKKYDKSIRPRYRILTIGLLSVCLFVVFPAAAAQAEDYSVLNGEWVRPDGGYLLKVNDAKANGAVDAAYFNPNPIHVAEANVSMWKGLKKLFVKLQGKGYPGSTYTLYYFEDKDALAGFYYQAPTGQAFEVIFVRRPPIN